jgi:hypothetical protein
MQELGINLDDQDSLPESRDASSENIVSENEKENKQSLEEDIVTNKDEDNVIDDSIESIPFISEPVKKKRTRSSK